MTEIQSKIIDVRHDVAGSHPWHNEYKNNSKSLDPNNHVITLLDMDISVKLGT